MLRTSLIVSLLSATLLFGSSQLQGSLPPAGPVPGPIPPVQVPCDFFLQHPLLVYQMNGSSFAGPIYRQLIVNSDGFVTLSGSFLGASKAEVAFVDVAKVKKLHNVIIAAGSMTNCDVPSILQISDAPMETLTTFRRNSPDTTSHTFTFAGGDDGSNGAIASALNNFMNETFPNF
ncbi:MAG: hypothetical protein ACKVS6_14165 [Planctomycetota bacterium]